MLTIREKATAACSAITLPSSPGFAQQFAIAATTLLKFRRVTAELLGRRPLLGKAKPHRGSLQNERARTAGAPRPAPGRIHSGPRRPVSAICNRPSCPRHRSRKPSGTQSTRKIAGVAASATGVSRSPCHFREAFSDRWKRRHPWRRLSDMIHVGYEMQVRSKDTGRDITAQTLAQTITEGETQEPKLTVASLH